MREAVAATATMAAAVRSRSGLVEVAEAEAKEVAATVVAKVAAAVAVARAAVVRVAAREEAARVAAREAAAREGAMAEVDMVVVRAAETCFQGSGVRSLGSRPRRCIP